MPRIVRLRTPTERWMLGMPFERLEARINKMSEDMKKHCLDWAHDWYQHGDNDHARARWAVAILGTLDPNCDEMKD